jgi:hypothetical protein
VSLIRSTPLGVVILLAACAGPYKFEQVSDSAVPFEQARHRCAYEANTVRGSVDVANAHFLSCMGVAGYREVR